MPESKHSSPSCGGLGLRGTRARSSTGEPPARQNRRCSRSTDHGPTPVGVETATVAPPMVKASMLLRISLQLAGGGIAFGGTSIRCRVGEGGTPLARHHSYFVFYQVDTRDLRLHISLPWYTLLAFHRALLAYTLEHQWAVSPKAAARLWLISQR